MAVEQGITAFGAVDGAYRQRLDQANLRQQLEFADVPTSRQIWVIQEDLWVYETLLRAIANKIWYIEDQELKEYPGNYEAFEYHMNQRAAAKKEAASQAAKEASAAKQQQAKAAEAAKPDFQQNREKQKRARKLKGDIERVENEITKLEEKKKGLIESMGSPEMAAKFSELERLQKEATAIDKQVLPLQNEWERLLQEADDEGIEL